MRRVVFQWLLMSFALVWGAVGCGKPPVESRLEVAFVKLLVEKKVLVLGP